MTKHPAVMGKHILDACAAMLPERHLRILDPFAGIGTTAKLLPQHDVVGVELEEEWASQDENTIHGNALTVVPTLGLFDVILTSPTYGNRMADDFEAGESSRKRITYRHRLGKHLSEGTTCNLHYDKKNKLYESLHEQIWKVCVDALKPDGLFILNCKDFVRAGNVCEVTQFHIGVLDRLGLDVLECCRVPSRGMRFGANSNLRIDYENVIKLSKTKH